RSSMTVTRSPCSRSASARWLPMKPAPPVISACLICEVQCCRSLTLPGWAAQQADSINRRGHAPQPPGTVLYGFPSFTLLLPEIHLQSGKPYLHYLIWGYAVRAHATRLEPRFN